MHVWFDTSSSSFFIQFCQLREDHAIDYNEFMQLFPVRVQRMRELKDGVGALLLSAYLTNVLQVLSGIQVSMHNV